MLKRIYNNVVDHKLLDNGREVYDITSVDLPTIEFETSDIKAPGMVGTFAAPNESEIRSMELSIKHNNGTNCEYLAAPGKHEIEFRLARQRFNVAETEMEGESVKYRFMCFHKSSNDGTVENSKPLSGDEKYSVSRMEKIVDGRTVTLIDLAAGIVRINGIDYTDKIRNLLN